MSRIPHCARARIVQTVWVMRVVRDILGYAALYGKAHGFPGDNPTNRQRQSATIPIRPGLDDDLTI